jgi:hypothetical protein
VLVVVRLVWLLIFTTAFLGNQGCLTSQPAATVTITSPQHGAFTAGPNLHGTFNGVAVATLQSALPPLLEPVLPTLGSGLGAFPLPSFLGLALQSVEVSRTGGFLTLYANLAPAP